MLPFGISLAPVASQGSSMNFCLIQAAYISTFTLTLIIISQILPIYRMPWNDTRFIELDRSDLFRIIGNRTFYDKWDIEWYSPNQSFM